MVKSVASHLLVVFTFLIFQCSENGMDYARPEFVGDWIISEVAYDGVLQTEWIGATFTFTQLAMDSGEYFLPETQYDSIWKSKGSWVKLEGNNFDREDKITVTYWIDEQRNKMTLNLFLPWTAQDTCLDGICLNVVTGQWTFELQK